MLFFRLLETKVSEANTRKLFSAKYTIYVPDYFFAFFFTSLIIFSCFLDLILTILMFTSNTSLVLSILFMITAYLRIISEMIVEKETNKSFLENKKQIFGLFLNVLRIILGLHSITISTKILRENLEISNSPNQSLDCFTYPIFHISHENLSLIKIYCYIYLTIRCIPQLFLVSVFIGLSHPTGITAYFSTANIVLNMVLFAFTISVTLPIRKTPRIYTNFACLLFSAINKFLATVCGVCVNLLVFMATFRNVKYYAFLAHFIKTVIWLFPCYSLLSNQPIPLSSFQFVVYLTFFPLVFSFVFVHPFEKTWRLFYYFSYLFNGLLDLAFLGLWANAAVEDFTYFCILKCVQIGFLSCFGLLNSIRKGRACMLSVKMNKDTKSTGQVKDMSEASCSKEAKDEATESTQKFRTFQQEIISV